MFNNVLVALKPGLPAKPLLDLAKQAASPTARLHLVSRVQVGDGLELEHLERARASLAAYVAELNSDGFEASLDVSPVVAAAAMDITKVIDDWGADLVVIGLAKRSRVSKLLLGSDAQRVIMDAGCPVLSARLHPDGDASGTGASVP